jgi:heme o synthase
LYLGAYTPLKKRTPLATAVGAFPGALPPLIGWAAATGSISLGGWILFAILFFWQFPHFMAIAWMYREDYARAGIKMLPVVDPKGDATFAQIIWTSALLVPASLLPSLVGMAGIRYFFGALVLGMVLLQVGLWANRTRTNIRAKWLMHATVVHIPLLLGWMIFDKLGR